MTDPTDQPGPEQAGPPVVRIFGLDDGDAGRVDRRPFQRADDLRLGWGEVPVDKLRQRVGEFLTSMRAVLADVPAGIGEYRLDQVQISAEVSAKGQISLLGTGGELAGKAGLTFTFKLDDKE
ncbi:Pepco domain-containing protein [Paractinoplanes durhamensis]|uniref:Pepco domain-containing protein n=1 Tax=Paractinoplanes durhamensis TaxID=113563 RepID=A0ABQ3YRF0_9ACTN|nr:hypothetical protein [Actinoplanes durhamensis]GID99953.1 hypothetical protein Adu01nite_13040 [Actinoplanes durhamensis]